MVFSTQYSRVYFLIAVMLLFSLILAGCGQTVQPLSDPGGSESGEGEALDEIDLSSPAEEEEGEDEGDDSGEGSESDDVSPVMAHCPAEPLEMNLILNHTWDFSPNRELQVMRVDGSTGAFVPCPLTVHRGQVSMEDCYFPVTNTGFINTDAGPCDIEATGEAILSLESGSCEDGVVTLQISEVVNPDVGLSGAMNCPKTSQPYFAFYPPSINTLTFPIGSDPASQTETMDPDLTNQFRYQKQWSLYSPEIPAGGSEE